MSYKTLFCLGVTTLLVGSTVPALTFNLSSQKNRGIFTQEDLSKDFTLTQGEMSTLIAARKASDLHPPE